MASSSKPEKEMTAEEIMADKQKRQRMIISGTEAGNGMLYTPGTEIMMNKEGNGFSMGNDLSDQFYWNEKTGDYRSNGGGMMSIAEIPQAQAAAAPDKGPKKKKKKKPETGEVVYPDGKVIDTNPGGGYGSWQDRINMGNYQPVTPNTHLNPLADANNWMYTPDPQYGVINNPGIYVNNPKPKGLI